MSTALPAAVHVRPARPEDADALASCHLQCWEEAYVGLVAQERLDEAVAKLPERAARWRSILSEPHGTLVAVAGREVVGFASAGPGRDDDLDLDLELYALYVLRARWDTGLGHRLLTAVLGERDALLWVFRDNVRARQFYAAHGFVADGAEKPEPYFDRPEIRMVRRARPTAR